MRTFPSAATARTRRAATARSCASCWPSMAHDSLEPSDWVRRWAPLVARGPVLDVASGAGRHSRLFASRNLNVIAVDRDLQALPEGITFVKADLEDGSPWPFEGRRFGGIVVTNYLHRPLLPVLARSLAEGGVLIYETFMLGNEKFGKPSRSEERRVGKECRSRWSP